MRFLLNLLLFCLLPFSALAQSQLPECRSASKHNCVGTETFADGGKYVGEFKDNKLNGQGTFTYPRGGKYVGEWRGNNRHGQGTMTYANGNKYVGAFKDGKRHGQGTLDLLADNQWKGDKYVGEYKDDQRTGQGTYTSANGNKFVGEFMDNKRNGQGIEYASSGVITKQGRWENGNLVQSFAVDNQRFLFNSSLTASAPQAPVPDPVTAERDRLAADLEVSRKKQQDLEEQLRVSQAAPAPNIRITESVPTERRVALVIGNAAYKVNPLKNPVNDARDMANSLRGYGFTVIERTNLTTRQVGQTLREFRSKLTPGSVAVVYNAGHGVQIKGENYLPTVDAEINGEEDVPMQSLSTKQVMDLLGEAKTRMNLVFLDACRDNPYARSFRSGGRGIAKENAPSGTLISFATRPGSVAGDGDGRNGLYTTVLLEQIKQSSQPIEQLLKNVVRGVKLVSKGQQEPWMEGSIEGDFCFSQCGSSFDDKKATVDTLRLEMSFWESIRDSKNRNDFIEYLKQFPEGKFSGIARNRLDSTLSSVPLVSSSQPPVSQSYGRNQFTGTSYRPVSRERNESCNSNSDCLDGLNCEAGICMPN